MSETKKDNVMNKPHSVRLPSDTPGNVVDYLNAFKNDKSYKFSNILGRLIVKGALHELKNGNEVECILVKTPFLLTKEEKEWLSRPQSEALLGAILFKFIKEPQIIANIISTSFDFDESVVSEGFTATPDKVFNETEKVKKRPISVGNNDIPINNGIDKEEAEYYLTKKGDVRSKEFEYSHNEIINRPINGDDGVTFTEEVEVVSESKKDDNEEKVLQFFNQQNQ